MKKTRIMCAALIAVLLTSCGQVAEPSSPTVQQSDEQPSQVQTEPEKVQSEDDFRKSYLQFTSEMMKKVNNEQGNTCISAYSIEQAFGMLCNGAQKNTKAEIESVFGSNSASMNEYMKKWRENQPDDEDCFVKTANALFTNEDLSDKLHFLDSFSDTVTSVYNGEIRNYSFEKEGATPINDWSNEHTDGLIPELLKELKASNCAVLANTSLFEAKWETEWAKDPYHTKFTDANSKDIEVEFMSDESLDSYFEYDGNEAFTRPYKNNQYVFVGIKPKESANAFISEMNADTLQNLLSDKNKKEEETHVYMPSFTYDTDLNLNDPLKAMGMIDAFDPMQANFWGMAESNGGEGDSLWIDTVIHKTHIEVDKEGTKAAAATAIVMSFSESVSVDAPKYHTIVFNSPFVYMIYDTKEQLPLFIGTVNTLEGKNQN